MIKVEIEIEETNTTEELIEKLLFYIREELTPKIFYSHLPKNIAGSCKITIKDKDWTYKKTI